MASWELTNCCNSKRRASLRASEVAFIVSLKVFFTKPTSLQIRYAYYYWEDLSKWQFLNLWCNVLGVLTLLDCGMIPVTYWPPQRGNHLWLQLRHHQIRLKESNAMWIFLEYKWKTNSKCVIYEGLTRNATNLVGIDASGERDELHPCALHNASGWRKRRDRHSSEKP